jgi:hypothetical protein
MAGDQHEEEDHMTAAAIDLIKLKTAGTTLSMRVESAAQVPVGKYPEYAFIGTEIGTNRSVELRMPKVSADRQLERLELTLEDAVGLALLFSRDENPNDAAKPYWGIAILDSEVEAPPQAEAATPLKQPATAPPSGHALYEKITDYVLTRIAPKYRDAQIGLSPEAAAAIAATLYIQASKAGK